MNPPPRTPVVLGLGPRTGASTVAAALHAHDGGVRDVAADIAVCAGTEESLGRAGMLAVAGTRPLLAVVLLDGGPAPARSRLRLVGMRYAGVIVLPHVEAWSGLTRPAGDVATLLGEHPYHLPPAHHAYAAALRAMTAALLGTGLLDNPRPPVVAMPRPGCARPVSAPPPLRRPPVRLTVIGDAAAPPSRRVLPPCAPPRPRVDGHLSGVVVPIATRPVSAGAADLDDLDDEALEHAVALLGTR